MNKRMNLRNKGRTTRVILALFGLVLLIASCDWLGGGNPLADRPTGIKGIDLIISDYPENEVYKGDQFSYTIALENNGYATSERAKLIARNSPYFTRLDGEDVVQIENLAGKNKNPSGGYKGPYLHRFQVTDIPSGTTQGKIQFPATLCYTYQTNAVFFVCGGKVDYNSAGDSQECSALDKNSELISGGQGAPIAITTVKNIQILPVNDGSAHYTRFTFEIANEGKGSVYADTGQPSDLDNACSGTLPSAITNYQVEFGSNKRNYDSKTDTANGLRCSPSSLNFNNPGNPAITCTQDESTAFPVGASVGVPVRVTLNYIYQIGESVPITLRNPDGN